MRISDWSSDVCSSDLATAGGGGAPADKLPAQGVAPARRDQGCAGAAVPAALLRRALRPARRAAERVAAGQRRRAAAPAQRRGVGTADRTRAGSGTSVSVRVDVVGPGISKKKKK